MFLGGQSLHTCSGAVLHSATGDLILTAAHCLAAGVEAYFVPGFTERGEPGRTSGTSTPSTSIRGGSPTRTRWRTSPLPGSAATAVVRSMAQAGGGFDVGQAPKAGTDVTVTGYALGAGGHPIGCTARTAASDRGFPSLPCAGLVDGTSGAPWVAGPLIAGLIGGLEGGGCEENVSYSPPFDDAVKRLQARAEAGGPADDAPTVVADGC